jgi:hypothetical protein
MTPSRTAGALFLTLLTAAAGAASVAAREPVLPQAQSVVSIAAPGHGSAFAYGRTGQLLTTRSAVGSARSTTLVTISGERVTATVTPTSDPEIVALQTSLTISVLAGATPDPGEAVVAQDGPLHGSGHRHGRLLSLTTGLTSIVAFAAYDGAPILDSSGAVVGIAEIDATRIRLGSLSGLSLDTGGGVSLLLVVLLVLAAIGVVAGGLLFAASKRPSPATRRSQKAGVRYRERSADADVEVSLRSRDYTPDPSVELRRPPERPGRREDGTPDA